MNSLSIKKTLFTDAIGVFGRFRQARLEEFSAVFGFGGYEPGSLDFISGPVVPIHIYIYV